MPTRSVFPKPLPVYDDWVPSYGELSVECWSVAWHRYFPDDTLRDRLRYGINARRLRLAAAWAAINPLTWPSYMFRHALLRVAPRLALLLLAWYLLDASRRHLLGTGASFAELGSVIGVAVLAAMLWGILRWPLVRPTLAWAEDYRTRRVERDRLLLSTAGFRGWRLVLQEDGQYLLIAVDGHRQPPN